MTPEEYKQLSIKEFTRAARIYDSDHAGIYEMCKHDYPPVLAELEKESFHDVLDCGCGTGPMDLHIPHSNLKSASQIRVFPDRMKTLLCHLFEHLVFFI